MHNDDVREKARTGLKNYIKSNPGHSFRVSETKKNNLPQDKIDIIDTLSNKASCERLLNEYGSAHGIAAIFPISVQTVCNYCKIHDIDLKGRSNSVSSGERQVNEFINSLGFTTVQSDHSILETKELDIVIPEKNLAIEFNGLYWHSSRYVDKNYHLNKTREANAVGYSLIHIFEDEWRDTREHMMLKLKSILGVDDREKVYGRKCKVEEIKDRKMIKDFYDQNHIQGSTGQTITFSLKHGDEIVALMSFLRRSDEEYDLNRYATSKRVVGGFSKLLKHAKDVLSDSSVKKVVSFADKRYSDGNLYIKTGWNHIKDIRPNYFYVVGDDRVRKENFRHARMENLEWFDYDPNLSEYENTINNNIYRIYDCGLMKFELEL